MAQNWLSYKKSNHLLDSSLVANDAYVGLNFLNTKKLNLDQTKRLTYFENVKRGLDLIDDVRYHISRSKDQVEKEELYSLIKSVSNDLKIKKPEELLAVFDKARKEISTVLDSKPEHLENSLIVLSSISKITSSELNSQYRYIR